MAVVQAGPTRRAVAPARLEWLRGELEQWQSAGILDAEAAAAISAQYVLSRRFALHRWLLGLGAAFLGVGVLWLVAANLEQLSPLARVVGTVVLWLGTVLGAELLLRRRAARSEGSGGGLVGVLQLLAVFAYGAVVFQAAQSLQVPAYTSGLLGVWGLGALLYAYAVRSVAPLVVGVAVAVGWYGWVVGERGGGAGAATVAMLVGGALASAAAVAHQARWLPRFAGPWREAGALLTLVGLFIAALPSDEGLGAVSLPVVLGLLAVGAAVGGAAFLAGGSGRTEVAVALAVVVAGILVGVWSPSSGSDVGGTAVVSGAEVAHALFASVVYLTVAAWFAALGVMRDAGRLTGLATAALVLFVTVQSFAVFQPILSGAALFLVLGVVLVGGGFLVDRGRRRLVASVTEVPA